MMRLYPEYKPMPWFGPDDYQDGDDIDACIKKREAEIIEWEMAWNALPWHIRFWRTLVDWVT